MPSPPLPHKPDDERRSPSDTATIQAENRQSVASGRAGYALLLLSLIGMLNTVDRVSLAAVLQPIKLEFGLSDGQLGLLSGMAFALTYAAMTIPLARLADRTNRVHLLGACLAIWSIMTATTGLARGFPQLLLARAGIGVGEAGCVPAAHSLIGDLLPPHRRAWGISVYNAGALAGVSLGLLTTGLLAEQIGWRSAVMVVGLAGLPLSLVVLLTISEPRRMDSAADHRENVRTAIGALLRRPALVHLTIALAIGGCANFGIAQWLPTFYQRSFGASLGQTGLWLGIVTGIGGIAGALCGGAAAVRLIPRDPRWELWLPGIAYGGAAPLYAACFLSPTMALAIAFNLAAVFVGSLGIGVALSAIQTFAEGHRRATAVSLTVFCSSLLGLGAGPLLIGTGSDALQEAAGLDSLRYALVGSVVFLVWAAGHFYSAAGLALRGEAGIGHDAVL